MVIFASLNGGEFKVENVGKLFSGDGPPTCAKLTSVSTKATKMFNYTATTTYNAAFRLNFKVNSGSECSWGAGLYEQSMNQPEYPSLSRRLKTVCAEIKSRGRFNLNVHFSLAVFLIL